MNKRKPDDEFARINLSFVRSDGQEQTVFCPESRHANATLEPMRRRLGQGEEQSEPIAEAESIAQSSEPAKAAEPQIADRQPASNALQERHFTIMYGDTGYTYDSIIGPYLEGARTVTIEDPYIRVQHQIGNFVRFCEALIKQPTIRNVNLMTSYDDKTDLADMKEKLEALKQSLLEIDVVLDIKLNPNLHDREIRLDNGWTIKIGRGLDFYQKPDSWFVVGANDYSLRKCLETKVDIFRQ